MQRFVVGFLFSTDVSRVALIRKARPDWQRGRLNGIGGRVEQYEDPPAAMAREFQEETGLHVGILDWRWFLELTDSGADPSRRVDFYAHRAPLALLFALKNPDTEEPIVVVQTDRLPEDALPNLRWLIPMAMDPNVASAWVRDQGRAA